MLNTKKEREQKHTVTALYSNTCFINNISNSESFQSENRFDPIVGKRCEIRFQHHMINISVFYFQGSRFKVQSSLLFVTYTIIQGIISSEM